MESNVIEILKNIQSKIEGMDKRIEGMDKRLDIIEKKTEGIKQGCSKMEDHIDFIQHTYNIVRRPLNYITNKVECIMGSSTNNSNLPEIKNNDEL
jgi:archaellum component FlaC